MPVQLASLSEAIGFLELGVAPECRLPSAITRPAGAAIAGFVELLQSAYVEPAEEPPPAPRLEPLRRAGVRVVLEAEFQGALLQRANYRRSVRGLVVYSGWTWADVVQTNEGS